MTPSLRICSLLLLVAVTTGCVKFKQLWTVQPDGSGKMTMTMGVSLMMLSKADGDPFDDLNDPAKMIEQEKNGWVAFSQPEVFTENGFKFAVVTGYFDDINQVTFSGSGQNADNPDMSPTAYQLQDNTLTVTNPMLGQVVKGMRDDPTMRDPAMKEMMAPMIEGLEMTETYQLSGPVQSAEGYQTQQSSATRTLTAADLLREQPPTIEGLEDDKLVIEFEAGQWIGSEDAWKSELNDAKAKWAELKQNANGGASSAHESEIEGRSDAGE